MRTMTDMTFTTLRSRWNTSFSLCRDLAMQQAAFFDGLSLDLLSSSEERVCPAEVDIGRRQVSEASVIAVLVVVIDKVVDRLLQRLRELAVLKQDAVLQGLVPALDLALDLRMVRSAAYVINALILEPRGQIAGYVGRAVVAKQPRPVCDGGAVAACCHQGVLQRVGNISGGGTEPPVDDVAPVGIKDRREVEPSPGDDLEVGEVGLPELVGVQRLVMELVGFFPSAVLSLPRSPSSTMRIYSSGE